MNAAEAVNEDRRRVVLVVEDEVLLRGTIAEFLRDQDYVVVEAVNAAEAMAVFASRAAIDIVFTDWQMPGSMDGVMLATWIGQHYPEVPVLLTSGFGYGDGWPSTIPRASFIPKPYLVETVAMRIRAALDPPGTGSSSIE